MAEQLALGPLFTSNMVLQREKPVRIFGSAQAGRSIALKLDGQVYGTRVQDGGQWNITLPPRTAGGPYTITIEDGYTSLTLQDIFFGEVWFAGGQSNMEMPLRESLDGEAALAGCADPLLRLCTVPKFAWHSEAQQAAEKQAGWQVCSPGTASGFSAVAYYCARRLRAELGVAVGVIGCYWGGTSISCWIEEATLRRSAAGKQYLDEYAALVGGKTDAEYEAEMEAYFAEWNAWDTRVQARRALDPTVAWEVLNAECGLCPWPQPAGNKSPFRPAGLNGSMVQRCAPYTIRGFLYYQGEEDYTRCGDYGEMLCYLVAHWRALWGDVFLPFYFVQLPMYVAKQAFEDGMQDLRWCTLRARQQWAAGMLANTGMAVALDLGEFDNIHPLKKQQVGERLALQALAKTYDKDIQADGPVPLYAEAQNGRVLVHFARHGGSVQLQGEGGFALAGPEGEYHPAKARVIAAGTIQLHSARVTAPCAAQYAWVPFGPTPLYGATGLPAPPFRIQI